MKSKNYWPKISVITPSYNQGQFIEETIKSVVEQNYPNLEYIIVDGASTDNSVSIIKKYAKKYPKIIKWISEKDKGQSDAINKGLRMSTGEILCYLNSDDCFTKGALWEVAKFFKKNKEAKWVTGDYIVINEKGEEIHQFVRWYKKIFSFLPRKDIFIKILNFINQPSTFWKREIYEKIGDFSLDFKYNMDYDYWLRIFNINYYLYTINKPLSKFRIHHLSKGGSNFKIQFLEDIEVLKRNTTNRFLIWLHKIHNLLIVFIYSLIK